ncbi:MAG: enoyl-CoA hydratase/isomerase family protein, partial [Acidobacteriaceae bacterium]
MEFETLTLTTQGPIAELTINRPDKLNALNARVLMELREAVAQLRKQEDIRAVILSGAGSK